VTREPWAAPGRRDRRIRARFEVPTRVPRPVALLEQRRPSMVSSPPPVAVRRAPDGAGPYRRRWRRFRGTALLACL